MNQKLPEVGKAIVGGDYTGQALTSWQSGTTPYVDGGITCTSKYGTINQKTVNFGMCNLYFWTLFLRVQAITKGVTKGCMQGEHEEKNAIPFKRVTHAGVCVCDK